MSNVSENLSKCVKKGLRAFENFENEEIQRKNDGMKIIEKQVPLD
jgi:hypothetical protein